MAASSLLRGPLPSLQVSKASSPLSRRLSSVFVGTPPASPRCVAASLARTQSCPPPSASLEEDVHRPLSARSIASASVKRTLPESPTKAQALASRAAYPTEEAEEACVGSWHQVASPDSSSVRQRLWHSLYRVHSMDVSLLQAEGRSSVGADLERMYAAPAVPEGSVFAAGEEPVADLCLGEQCVTADELGSAQALSQWLAQRLPPAAAAQVPEWGLLKNTKPVANLFQELQQGEISLEDGSPPKRTVHVASVKIHSSEGLVLVESHQSMGNGTVRPRNRPLSEKMKPGEGVEAACLRGICEELGQDFGARHKVRLLPGSYEREDEERESCSYPGLMTRYVLHSMRATIQGLPERAFSTVEDEGDVVCRSNSGGAAESQNGNGVQKAHKEGKIVGVRTHHWVWRSEEELGRSAPD